MREIIFNKIRIQILTEKLVRLEYARKGKFCDTNTFFIPNRTKYSGEVDCKIYGNFVLFGEYSLYIPEGGKSLTGIQLLKDGKILYTYKRLKNSGELPALDRTPEAFALSDNPRITVPEGGYSYHGKKKNSGYKLEENVQDIYLLICEGDAKELRRMYVELTGRSELVRLSTLGGWNSKYYAYSQEEAKQLILDYESHKVPLDNMVIDTDWRSCENGWGYDINTSLFPDMKKFLSFAHSHGVEIMFNDHPEPVEGAHVFEPREILYREKNLQALMKLGLDIWWYDRNWTTHLISPTPDIYWETFGLYLFEEITKHYYQKKAKNNEIYRRPVIMGNVVNVANGCYSGIQDSASHRYSVQWTGDISSQDDSLAQEVENLIRCSDNGISYVNSDCGGHVGNPDKELFIRWMQFGCLSPVFRPHCTNNVERTREPWVYDEETLNIVREYNNLRYRLLPVIYKNAFNNYITGEPIFKSLGYEYPNDRKAVKRKDVYMLGNDLLISPIAGIKPESVLAGNYTKPVKAEFYNGTELQGDSIAFAEWKTLSMDLRHESPVPGVPAYYFSAKFETAVKFDKPVQLFVKCDDGSTVYVDGEKVLEDKTLHSALMFPLCELSADVEHTVRIEYFQAGGEACCGLYYGDIVPDNLKEIYLPKGKWLDVFDGKVYNGGKSIAKSYNLRSMPLFVRLGALIPLAYEAKNTKEQKWNKLVFDFYPDRDSCDKGYLYEDDTETTAYKLGEYRKSPYETAFNTYDNAFIVKFFAAKGKFGGEKQFGERDITLKYHLLKGADKVIKVEINGENAEFVKIKKDSAAFPLGTSAAPDSGIIAVNLHTDVLKDYEIKIYLEK